MQMEEKYWKRLEGFLLAVSVGLCLVVFHSVFRGLVYLLPPNFTGDLLGFLLLILLAAVFFPCAFGVRKLFKKFLGLL